MPCQHDGHRDRLKDRFLNSGLDGFEPHNVLELLLFYSIPRKDTNPIAHDLINRFGSLSEVFDADPEDLMKVDGITKNSAALISMIPQLARRYLVEKAEVVDIISGHQDLGGYLITHFVGRTEETIMLVALDNKNKIICSSVIAEGEKDWANVSKRTILKEAIRLGATKVVLAHNHPRGYAIPSDEDLELTRKAYEALSTIGVELLDHILVSEDDFVSLLASGLDFKK